MLILIVRRCACEGNVTMKNLLSAIFVILVLSSWLWPIIFISALFEAIKRIKAGEDYDNEKMKAILSLFMMTVAPYVISMLVTST